MVENQETPRLLRLLQIEDDKGRESKHELLVRLPMISEWRPFFEQQLGKSSSEQRKQPDILAVDFGFERRDHVGYRARSVHGKVVTVVGL